MKDNDDKHSQINRRDFFKTCAGAAAAIASNPALLAHAGTGTTEKLYFSVKLVDANGQAVTSSAIKKNQSYIFHYPFATTPCFLINLGRPLKQAVDLNTATEQSYQWPGGVGLEQSVVAFSAICSHKMSYPTRTLSFINYRPEAVPFRDSDSVFQHKSQLIYCCSERSAYDPAQGAAVLGGPRDPTAYHYIIAPRPHC